MSTEAISHGPLAGSILESQLGTREAIPQEENRPDREFPEVIWSQYGIVPTNEVAVTARCGPLAYYVKASSYLAHPSMADRIFGTDVLDIQLGCELSDHLWATYSTQLEAQALALRGAQR